jgi:membrane protein implicated in regulation of membrane protease activity
MNIYILVVLWFIGAAIAAIALFVPDYSTYFAVAVAGWIIVSAATGLIVYEIKRIRAEDRKRNELAEKG